VSVTRIDDFRAIAGRGEELRESLAELLPERRARDGCLSISLLEHETDPARYMVIEVWRDRASHEAAAAEMPPAARRRIMTLLAEMPTGGYYREHN
jgi:quinol monooxygenase YgiN